MTRRKCIRAIGIAGLFAFSSRAGLAASGSNGVRHIVLPVGWAPDVMPTNGMVTGFLRFGWKAFAVGGADGQGTVLRGLGPNAPTIAEGAECRLRLTNAIDVRDVHVIEVITPGGRPIGRFDLRFAGLYQTQEIPLRTEQARAILAEGAVFKMLSLRAVLGYLTSPSTNRLASLGTTLTTEGNYTLAYPTAVLSRVLDHSELAGIALRHLEARRLACVHDGDIYQRASMSEPGPLKNWCRGVCWYYLGLVRTLEALAEPQAIAAWLPEVRRVAVFLREHQRSDGLWGNFLHDPQSVSDTSGSAGVAAALARAHSAGWLDPDFRQVAQRTLAGLASHLTPDGLLGGAAQSNKGGESLQRSDHRVIYQMGMGLKAQLMAAVSGS